MAEFKSYSIKDAKIFPLTADTSATLTYGAAIDLPGIQSIGLRPNITSNDLKGDDKILDVETKLDSVEWSLTHAMISLPAISAMDGSTTATAGGVETNTLTGSSVVPYFKLEGQVTKVGGGDYHLTLFKCQATGGIEIEHSQDNYAVVSVSGRAIPTVNNDKIREFKKNSVETPIS